MYIITGQTATGKTKLALKLAKKHNGELINCDSRQIYKHLDIVTGKEFDKKIKIWLYDIVDPNQYFSSFDYVNCAKILINQLIEKGKTPIIVGGSYLYLKHLLYGFETGSIPPDFELREKLNSKSVAFLQKTLKTVNFDVFNALNNSDRNNPRRLIRKIEIATFKKNSLNSRKSPNSLNLINNKPKIIGLRFKNKSDLIAAIKTRVKKRLEQGAIDEVKKLISLGFSENDPGLKTIGYQQLFDYLNKKLTFEEMVKRWETAEIQYAKRQYTFMKKDKNILWKEITNHK